MRLIKLTDSIDRPVYINPEYITDMATVDHPFFLTRVDLTNGYSYYAVEDVETIAKMVAESGGEKEVIS